MGTITISGKAITCDLAHGDEHGRCSWCGGLLPPRRRRWCSEACAHAFADQHSWAPARAAALDRTGHVCERCDRRTLDLQVHHVELAAGYGLSCAHHQDPQVDLGLAVVALVEVSEESSGALLVVVEHPERDVALRAEDPSDASGRMVVVYVRDDLREAALADGTRVPLLVEHRSVVEGVEPVVETEVRCFGRALLRAVDGVGPASELGRAEETGARLFRDLPSVARRATRVAVERPGGSTGERSGALEAAVRERSAIEGRVAAEPGVVPFAHLRPLLGRGRGAVLDDAWQIGHNAIIEPVSPARLPSAIGGLEVLCAGCHRGEHQFRRDVDRLLVWADGHVSRQLVLPGVAA